MADPGHYPQRQMVQIDEELQNKGAPKLALQLACEEPQLTVDTGEKPVEFLVNTRTTYSVLNTRSGRLGHKSCKIVAVSGEA